MADEPRIEWRPEMSDGSPTAEEFVRLQKEIQRVYPQMMGRGRPETPDFSIWFGDEDLVLSSQMPDLDPESVRVALQGQRLTIRGQLQHPPEGSAPKDAKARTSTPFQRIFTLPWPIDPQSLVVNWTMNFLIVQAHRLPQDRQEAA